MKYFKLFILGGMATFCQAVSERYEEKSRKNLFDLSTTGNDYIRWHQLSLKYDKMREKCSNKIKEILDQKTES